MKKTIVAVAALLCVTGAFAQEESSSKSLKDDPVTYLDKNEKISIESGSLGFGWNFGLNMPDNMDTGNGHSMFVAWDLAEVNFQLGNKQNKLSLGFGMTWNKYATSNKGYFYLDENNHVATSTPDMGNSEYSRYLTYGLTVPVMYNYTSKCGFFISAGPAVNFNVHSSIRTDFNGEKNKKSDVYQTPVTVDLRLMAGYKHIGLMFKYSPMNVIKSGKGPEFQSWGVGLVLK